MNKTKPKKNRIEKMEQHLINLDEMLNHQLYCLFIELADYRNEIKQLRLDLRELEEGKK